MLSVAARRAGAARAAAVKLMVQQPATTGQASALAATPRALGVAHAQKATFFNKLWNANMKEELVDSNATGAEAMEEQGKWVYNREPVHPPKGAGTKEMPFEVPSHYKQRAVGFEHPETHAIYWFNLHRGDLHYVKEIGMYFKLKHVPLPEGF